MNSISSSLQYQQNHNNYINRQSYNEAISNPTYDQNLIKNNKKVDDGEYGRNSFWNKAEKKNKDELSSINKNFSPQKPNVETNDNNFYDMFYEDKQKYLQKKIYSHNNYSKREENGNAIYRNETIGRNNGDQNLSQKIKNDNNQSFFGKSQNKFEETPIQEKGGKKHFFENAGLQILSTQKNVNSNLISFDNIDISDNVGKKKQKNYMKDNQETLKPKNIYDNFNEKLKHLDTLKKKYADNRTFDSTKFSYNNKINNNYNGDGPNYRQCLENRVLANKDKVHT